MKNATREPGQYVARKRKGARRAGCARWASHANDATALDEPPAIQYHAKLCRCRYRATGHALGRAAAAGHALSRAMPAV